MPLAGLFWPERVGRRVEVGPEVGPPSSASELAQLITHQLVRAWVASPFLCALLQTYSAPPQHRGSQRRSPATESVAGLEVSESGRPDSNRRPPEPHSGSSRTDNGTGDPSIPIYMELRGCAGQPCDCDSPRNRTMRREPVPEPVPPHRQIVGSRWVGWGRRWSWST